MTTKVLNKRQAGWAEFLANYDFVLAHIKGTKNPADGPSRRPDYMENVELPSAALIPRSALRMLQPEVTLSNPATVSLASETHASPLEAHWRRIGVHANTTPEASLRSRFVSALEKDPLAEEYRDNPPKPWL
jgi:hypothetical protein